METVERGRVVQTAAKTLREEMFEVLCSCLSTDYLQRVEGANNEIKQAQGKDLLREVWMKQTNALTPARSVS